jgi:hypothetical protein
MERLGLWIVVLTLAVVFAEPSRPDPVDTGSGEQRNFLWHGGGGSVKRLPSPEHHWVRRELPIAEPFDTGYTPGNDYDPLLDNAEAPFNPEPWAPQYARWQSPPQSTYCPTNGLTGTLAEPIGCYTNRPVVFEIEDREDFPGLDTIFEVDGADGGLGPNPDYFLAQPVDSCEEMGVIMDEFRERCADPGRPDPTTQEFEALFRGLAHEDDAPANRASRLPFTQRANPFRGRETPTRIIRAPQDVGAPRFPGQRYHILDAAGGIDPIDERLCMLEELTMGVQDCSATICGQPPYRFGPYPNRFFGESFGGDFSGIAARFDKFTDRPTFGAALKSTSFIQQIAVSDTPGYNSICYPGAIPYTNIAVTGGQGELPMRVAPDWSNLSEPDLLAGQGLDYPFPDRAAAYERNVDPNTGRPRKAGATGPCENAAGFQTRRTADAEWLLQAGNPVREFIDGDATAAPSGGATVALINDDYKRWPYAYTALGIGIDDGCLKPGGVPGYPNENRFDPELTPSGPADFGIYSPPSAFNLDICNDPTHPNYDPENPNCDSYIPTTLGQWSLEGSSEDFALKHHPANQSLFAWICSASRDYFAGLISGQVDSAPGGACFLNLFGSPAPLISIGGINILPFSEYFAVLTGGSIDETWQNEVGWRLLIQNTKADRTSRGFIPAAPLNRDVRDGMVTSTNSLAVPGGDPWSEDNWVELDGTLTNEQSALLGCGPFFGTRCDTGAAGAPFLPGAIGWDFGEGGGIDLLNAEGSAVTKAMAGTYGTGDVTPRWLPVGEDPEFTWPSDPPSNSDRESVLADTWVTWSDDA